MSRVDARYVLSILEDHNDYDDGSDGYFSVGAVQEDDNGIVAEAEFVYVGELGDEEFVDYHEAVVTPERVSRFKIKIINV